MSEKVYPMDENYNQAMADLLEAIELRDELAVAIKDAPPDRIREAQEILTQMTKKIDEAEAALAVEYETYQNQRRLEEVRDEAFDEMTERMAGVFIHLKYNHPDKLDEMKAIIFNDMTPEWIDAFYDRVAVLEATDLERIIAEDKGQ
ncbi:MAG TPA: hypothetical protein VGC97_22880 [Pyrinomonadaceae bacterium]|jgi:hypothetical protein